MDSEHNHAMMEAVTWIDRITEETNTWFVANKKEDENDYLQATLLYLKDATDCLKQDQVVKGALSSSCAADCLAKLGQFRYARLLYSETARIYLANAESVIAISVRESLWSLREAYEYFLLAEDWLEARNVHDRLVYLAKRVDPNFGGHAIAEESQPAALPPVGKSVRESQPLDNSSGVPESIERFLLLRRSRSGPAGSPAPLSAAKSDKRRRQVQDEKSIISQLG
jgi:hypothetical protein